MRSFPFIIICLAAFIYQSKILIDEYISGGTLVTLTVGPQDDTIPGLTLCTFDYYMYYFLRRDPHFQEVFSPYLNKLRKGNLSNHVFSYKLGEFIHQYVEKLNVSDKFALNILKNQSVIEGAIGFKFFITGIIINVKNGTETGVNSYLNPELMPIRRETHVSSMNFKGSPIKAVKCFTFFSWKFEAWNNYKLRLQQIEFHVWPTRYWFYDVRMWKELWLSIHSPNTIPNFNLENFIKVDFDDYARFHISQVNTELLGKGYDTNCQDYSAKDHNDTHSSKNECILDCLKNYTLAICRTDNFPPTDFLLTETWLEKNPKTKIIKDDSCLNDVLSAKEVSCTNQCPDECKFKYYHYEKNVLWKQKPEEAYAPGVVWPPIIELSHSHVPDLHLKHLPHMNFISFICNLCGLLCMWLGMSFLRFSNEMIKILLKLNLLINRTPIQNKTTTITTQPIVKMSIIDSSRRNQSNGQGHLKSRLREINLED